jgi:hypothetical protein
VLSVVGDEFHLVHVIKDETEQLREFYQEKSLVRTDSHVFYPFTILSANKVHVPLGAQCTVAHTPGWSRQLLSNPHHALQHC